MSLVNIAFLVMVVAGFSSFAVVLFSAWVWTNWSEWTAGRAPASAPALHAHAEPLEHAKAA